MIADANAIKHRHARCNFMKRGTMNAFVRAQNVARLIAGPVRDRGLREAIHSIQLVRSAHKREVTEAFDERFGTDTSRTFRWSDLDATGGDVPSLWRYYPITRAGFEPAMDAIGVLFDEFTFVDLGSGKGRALLYASDRPFRKIIGVEIAPALHEVAEKNVSVYGSPAQRCHRFELVCSDAAVWQPPDDRLLVYVFQPFPEDVFARVMENLETSLVAHPRPLVFVYLNPVFERAVVGPGFLETVARNEPKSSGELGWAVYMNADAARALRAAG
ncbi:MAG TPA: class I SAM-dependent methyltransferase [Polyangiaceae bacterium]